MKVHAGSRRKKKTEKSFHFDCFMRRFSNWQTLEKRMNNGGMEETNENEKKSSC